MKNKSLYRCQYALCVKKTQLQLEEMIIYIIVGHEYKFCSIKCKDKFLKERYPSLAKNKRYALSL